MNDKPQPAYSKITVIMQIVAYSGQTTPKNTDHVSEYKHSALFHIFLVEHVEHQVCQHNKMKHSTKQTLAQNDIQTHTIQYQNKWN